MNDKEIFERAHLNESSDMARDYFKKSGITYSMIEITDLHKLRDIILDEIYPLLADKTIDIVRELTVDWEINSNWAEDKKSLLWAHLYASGRHFSKKQAISFDEDERVGLCGWALGCNRIPFIKGFVKWCDWMRDKNGWEDTEDKR